MHLYYQQAPLDAEEERCSGQALPPLARSGSESFEADQHSSFPLENGKHEDALAPLQKEPPGTHRVGPKKQSEAPYKMKSRRFPISSYQFPSYEDDRGNAEDDDEMKFQTPLQDPPRFDSRPSCIQNSQLQAATAGMMPGEVKLQASGKHWVFFRYKPRLFFLTSSNLLVISEEFDQEQQPADQVQSSSYFGGYSAFRVCGSAPKGKNGHGHLPFQLASALFLELSWMNTKVVPHKKPNVLNLLYCGRSHWLQFSSVAEKEAWESTISNGLAQGIKELLLKPNEKHEAAPAEAGRSSRHDRREDDHLLEAQLDLHQAAMRTKICYLSQNIKERERHLKELLSKRRSTSRENKHLRAMDDQFFVEEVELMCKAMREGLRELDHHNRRLHRVAAEFADSSKRHRKHPKMMPSKAMPSFMEEETFTREIPSLPSQEFGSFEGIPRKRSKRCHSPFLSARSSGGMASIIQEFQEDTAQPAPIILKNQRHQRSKSNMPLSPSFKSLHQSTSRLRSQARSRVSFEDQQSSRATEFQDAIEGRDSEFIFFQSDVGEAEEKVNSPSVISEIHDSRSNEPPKSTTSNRIRNAANRSKTSSQAPSVRSVRSATSSRSAALESREWALDVAEYGHREQLPVFKPPNQKVSIWKVIKDSIGKDLSKLTVPVSFNEPLSMLQKISEIMEYQQLLVKANQCDDPVLRLIYVTVFNMAQYKCTEGRLSKPFNPILGETFELQTDEFKYLAEQVSHHPPVSACYAENREGDYQYWMNTNMKTNFWGATLEVIPIGISHIKLVKHNEMYSIGRPSTMVYNLIFGEMYTEQQGKMVCRRRCHDEAAYETEEAAPSSNQPRPVNNEFILNFKKGGWSRKTLNEVEGRIPISDFSEYCWRVHGHWNDAVFAYNELTHEEIEIWRCNPLPPQSDLQYKFTEFGINLNHLPDELSKRLPPTDSRFRPDQRAMENGDLDLASSEKHRLEEKQRAARKQRAENGEDYRSQYFQKHILEDPEDGSEQHIFKLSRDYWEDRAQGAWAHMADLF